MKRQPAPKTSSATKLCAITALASLVAAFGLSACEPSQAGVGGATQPVLPTEAELLVAKS